MGKEYIAKSFKSGNSVAIRLPAALGIEPDREWTVSEVDGELIIRAKAQSGKRIDLTGIYGSCPGLKPLAPEDRLIETREPDWEGKRLGHG
ncbi:hypothetical protein [Novosphingobium sp.]|uniref:AbrB/MazE/SpoVT family DNA-binding domain-containing protein n=1 Tax=Novosphingobium sp. TaxID=1874826 RepID=UPI002732B538|nr:hypothetical protein [Novosphingobium sp.]MDP3906789.1 hypothetical protein [Novosphingobium sp.]